ncbi:cellulose binding domain-containing protein [Virgisporangium ochraceum]|uniref:cellulose binding domain-containing protein n=1 Tax=Virgisporangium ochraceum TaxID=65505 RepID=UPI001943C796|nr:cellulose binding domain-containing protein [Virgisporangium ochraceum]
MLDSSRRGWRVLVGFAVSVAAAALVFAGAPAASAATVFQDSFSDGNADGWTLTNGAWAVAAEDGNPALRQSSAGSDARAIAAEAGRGTALGTIVQARLKPHSRLGSDGSISLLFHALDADNYAFLRLTANRVELGRRQNGATSVFASAPYTPVIGTWQVATLDLSFPNQVRAVVAGTSPGVQVVAAIPTATGSANKVGFAARGAVASFDDVRISDDVPPIDTTPPSAPGTPVASAITPNGFTLSWPPSADNVGVVGYQVTTVVPPGSAAPIRIWTTGTNSITITDLPPRSTNTFQVRAFDAVPNYSQPSPQITVTTAPPQDQTPPTAPGTPVATAVAATSVTLTWAAATDNVGVTAYYLRNPAGTVATGPFTGATATMVNLAPATTYTWVVVAVDAANNISDPSGQITVTTPADTPICEYSYRVVNQWQGGFQAEVTIRNVSGAPVQVDRIHWTFTNGETINNIWNAAVTITGSTVTLRPTSTAIIPPGGTFTFGFVGTGTPVPPNPIYLNGFRCRQL